MLLVVIPDLFACVHVHFKYLGSVITRDGYCTREVKMSIVIAKEALTRAQEEIG
jgi:hypothetical protein